MLIIKMIRRITGLNQEELANILNVSRASINSWENTEGEMTTYQKNIISEAFNIPYEYLDEDISKDIDKCKKVYTIIKSKWEEMNQTKENTSDEDLINEIEYLVEKDEKVESMTDLDIINGLANGFDPYTGEIFPENHILNDEHIKNVLSKIRNIYFKYGSNIISKDDLSSSQQELFKEFQKWRMDKTREEGYYSAYMIFNDRELINIITANISRKEDLLGVKGIGRIKYDKYADEIFDILTKGHY